MPHSATGPMTAHPAGNALFGDIQVPGDKSISHRSLMIASQAVGQTHIEGLLEGEDVLATAAALRTLGVKMERNKEKSWTVHGVGVGGLCAPDNVLDMGNSGTSTRLLMGLVAPYAFNSFFTGDPSLRRRPMRRAIEPLSQMGVQCIARTDASGKGGLLPLAVLGNPLTMPITYRSPIASAQVKSCVLLAGLNTAGRTTVIEPQKSRDHTERMLRDFGVEVTEKQVEGGIAVSLTGQPEIVVSDKQITVPGDPSSAAFPLVAALIVPGSRLTIRNVCLNPERIGLLTTLREMGAKLSWKNERTVGGEPVADIEVEQGALKGVTVPAERAPSMIDEYPILAVAASFAEGETAMHGLSELRVKESDRLTAMAEGLAACGVKVRVEGDSLYVRGGTVKGGATIATQLDHRLAMSFLVMGMASQEPVTVDDVAPVATSFPDFLPLMEELGARIRATPKPQIRPRMKPLIIAIDGPAASGKGTLARQLASYFGYAYLDTGRLYRAVALRLSIAGKEASDEAAALIAAREITEEDLLNPRLRQENIGSMASVVSAYAGVRDALLEFQRRFAKRAEGAVLDGRDIGTVVCPEADLKLFITADVNARAERRYVELHGAGMEVSFEEVLEELKARDARDMARAFAPLKPADDAVFMDTSNQTALEVFEAVVELTYQRFSERKAA